MMGSFTLGDVAKYDASHREKTLIIGNWELFDKDWGILKDKGAQLDRLDKFMERYPEITSKLIEEMFTKAESFTKFLKEADKEIVLDLVGAQYADNQLNRIQKVVRKLRKEYDDTDHDNPYLGKKIIELEGILGIEPI